MLAPSKINSLPIDSSLTAALVSILLLAVRGFGQLMMPERNSRVDVRQQWSRKDLVEVFLAGRTPLALLFFKNE